MKIGIMTWFHYLNYGTALQAVALNSFLKKSGHLPQTINYKPCGYHRALPDYSIISLGKRMCLRLMSSKQSNPTFLFSENKQRLFKEFLADNIDFTAECDTSSDLSELNDRFDAFICGSDQIWSPLTFNPHYFLDFVYNPSRKISYAPSIGVEKIEDKFIKHQIKSLISDFGALSVRESSGKRIIKELTVREADITLDPTMLLNKDEWLRFLPQTSSQDKGYILAYMLGCNESHWQKIKDTAIFFKKDIKIIPIFEQDLSRSDCVKYDVGPVEFLQLFYNADYICTDSFHGTVFSLLFHKPFTVFERFSKNDSKNQNSRVHCLLDTVKMRNRLLINGNYKTVAATLPDFALSDKILDDLRQLSIDFLNTALLSAERTKVKQSTRIMQQNQLCCGCGACASVCPVNAINICRNDNGFFAAEVNSNCIGCAKCKKACPFEGRILSAEANNAKLYDFKSRNAEILLRSTSGGAAYQIAQTLIDRGYKICGCHYDPVSRTAKHIIIDKITEIELLQGSKYIQSRFNEALYSIKKDINSSYTIFGTPCQIAGAKRALANRDNIVYVDLVCHGVPTSYLFDRYLDHIRQSSNVDITHADVTFRYKACGWRNIHLYAYDGVHEYCCSKNNDPFFRLFETGVCYMPACYECRWRVDSEADIRLGDYWGPKFAADETGVNMLLCFTEKGLDIVSMLQKDNCAIMNEQPISDYLNYQQSRNLPKPVFYDSIIAELLNGRKALADIAEKYASPFENTVKPIGEHIKYLFKMLTYKEQ